MTRQVSTHDLSQCERRFCLAMNELWYGRLEFVRIESGALVLDPWPTVVKGVKFASREPVTACTPPRDFELKAELIEFFAYVRSVDAGEIRRLEVKHGLPFSMEIEHSLKSPGVG
jgi:hypothetical protein